GSRSPEHGSSTTWSGPTWDWARRCRGSSCSPSAGSYSPALSSRGRARPGGPRPRQVLAELRGRRYDRWSSRSDRKEVRLMPRIDAPTLAEHRAKQREGLLTAATDILVTKGAMAVNPAAVGAAAGLARSSVYQYFSSGAGIIAAIIEDAFPRSNELMREALDGLTQPWDIVDAYVRETLRQAADGAHRPAAALRTAALPIECLDRLGE